MKNQTVLALSLMALAGTAIAAPRESRSVTDPVPVYSDVSGLATPFTLNFTGVDGTPYTAARAQVTGELASNTAFTWAADTLIDITPPGGAPATYRISLVNATYVTQAIDYTAVFAGGAVNPAGDWSFRLHDDFEDGDGASPEAFMNNLVITLDDASLPPPSHEDLGALVDGTPITRSETLGAGEVKWYRVTFQASTNANGRNIDVHTLGSFAGDSEIAVYNAVGGGLFANDDAGGGFFSQLLLGYNGLGDIAAGNYFIALSSYNAVFGLENWNVTSTGPGGEFELSISSSVTTPPIGWDETVDGGGDAGDSITTFQTLGGEGPIQRINGTFVGGVVDVDLYKINICDFENFRIDTDVAPRPDTQLSLYTTDGTPIVFNDDNGGGGLWSLLDSTTALVTANGDYLLAVSRWDNDAVDGGGNEIWLDTPYGVQRSPDGPGAAGPLAGWNGTNTTASAYGINLLGGVCRVSAGSVCGPADIGSTGGTPGADGRLDNNDFIVFIDRFFNNLPSADIGTTGGAPGSDGQWNNNDFIVFIDQFFSGPVSCR